MRRRLIALLCVLFLCACVPEAVLQNGRGNARYASGAYDEALEAYGRAQVDAPERPEPYYNAANAHNRLGQVDETLAQARQALKSDDAGLQAPTWYNLGNAYFDAQRWAEAIEAYREALRLDPGDLDAKHNLELALRELAQQQERQSNESQSQESQESPDQSDAQKSDQQQDEGSQGPNEQPTPSLSPGTSGEADGEQEPTPQPEGQPQEGEGMSREQAQRLLQALVGDSQTLQERLQEESGVPVDASREDW